MTAPEFSRIVKLKALPAGELELTASDAERVALAERFSIEGVAALEAKVDFEPKGANIRVTGELVADIVQACAISGDDFAHRVNEDLDLIFVPAGEASDPLDAPDPGSMSGAGVEIELQSEELDEIEYEGNSFDLGEAIAQSLGLAIDPYAEGPNADEARKAAGITTDDAPSGPLAEALKGLKTD